MISGILILIGLCAILAYIPIMLVVVHSKRPKKLESNLIHEYVVKDKMSTEDFLKAFDSEWDDVDHVPLD